MTDHAKRLTKRIYAICLALLTLLTGILFIVQVFSIYRSAESQPYTVERISAHFWAIAPVFFAWLLAVVAGGVIWTAIPDAPERPKAYIELKTTLEKFEKRLPLGEIPPQAKRLRAIRTVVWCVSLACCIVSAIVSFTVLTDKSYTPRFQTEFFTAHGGAADRLVRILPWILAGFFALVFASVFAFHSEKKQIGIVKTAVAERVKKTAKETGEVATLSKTQTALSASVKAETQGEKKARSLLEKYPFLQSKWWGIGLKIAIGALGVALVVVGIFNGGMEDVLLKAVKICTQCIGLG